MEGLPLRLRLTGWAARIAQHEVDHLAGVLYVDRMDARSLAAADNMPEWVRWVRWEAGTGGARSPGTVLKSILDNSAMSLKGACMWSSTA